MIRFIKLLWELVMNYFAEKRKADRKRSQEIIKRTGEKLNEVARLDILARKGKKKKPE